MNTRRRWLFFIEPSLLLIAFLLQLLISISTPIVKAIDLFSLQITTSAVVANQGEIRFGLWGLCFLNQFDTDFWDYGDCTEPRVGYSIDPTIMSILGLSPYLYDLITQALTSVLIVHPVVATLTLISIVPACFPFYRPARIMTLIINVISALLSTLVASIDIAIILTAQSKLVTLTASGTMPPNLGMTFRIDFGNAPWMGLAAVIALWLSVVVGSALICSCCGRLEWDEVSQNCDDQTDDVVGEVAIVDEKEGGLWRRRWKLPWPTRPNDTTGNVTRA